MEPSHGLNRVKESLEKDVVLQGLVTEALLWQLSKGECMRVGRGVGERN